MWDLLKKLGFILDRKQKREIGWILLLMLLGAGLETLGVGLVFPVVNLIVKPDILETSGFGRHLPDVFHQLNFHQRVIWASVGLLAVFLIKNVGLAIVQYIQNLFVFRNQVDLSEKLFRSHMGASYLDHISRNTSDILRVINLDTVYLYQSIVSQFLVVASEALVLLMLMILLMFIDPVTTLSAIAIQGGAAFLVYWWVKGRVTRLGFIQQDRMADMIKWVNQGLGGIKETKITHSEPFFVSKFRENAEIYAEAQRYLFTLNQMPRLILEVLAVSTLTLIVTLFLLRDRDLALLISTVAAFGMAAVRVMPGFTRILSALNLIRYYASSVTVIADDLKKTPLSMNVSGDLNSATSLRVRPFTKVSLEQVSFSYPGSSRLAIDHLNCEIQRNSSIAFVGKSGAGKSTIVDMLLGLIHPTSGKVLVDGHDVHGNLAAWQAQLGYVPQTIYLTDDTIRRNIALGISDELISDDRIWQTLASVQLDDFVRGLPDGLETKVGERGVRISGGQRQRIGIARALYRDPEILVFDEATSALDTITEKEIMRSISGLKGQKTFIMIAHRLSTVRGCDLLYFMKDGKVMAKGSFDELCARSEEFNSMAREAQLI